VLGEFEFFFLVIKFRAILKSMGQCGGLFYPVRNKNPFSQYLGKEGIFGISDIAFSRGGGVMNFF